MKVKIPSIGTGQAVAMLPAVSFRMTISMFCTWYRTKTAADFSLLSIGNIGSCCTDIYKMLQSERTH